MTKDSLIGFLLGIPLLLSASVVYDCSYEPGSLQYEVKDGWDFIQVKGLDVTEEIGKPMIPLDYIHLLIPQGQEAESINVTINSSSTIEGTYRIKPFSPDKDSSEIDLSVYNSNEPYPGIRALIVKTGSFSSNRIVDIKVYPVDYSPESGKIVLYTDLTIELFYGPSMRTSVKPLYRTPYGEHIIQKSLTSIVDNAHDILSYSYKPFTRDNLPQGKSNPSYPPYIVITADSLMDAFRPLIHWITKKGIQAEVVSIDTILKNYSYDPVSSIDDSAGAIRGFLLDAYENGTQWVLLGGDEGIIPVRYGTSENNDSTVPEQTPADLYYSDLDGDWDVDGDDLYGEPVDDAVGIYPYPELFIGRLPCNKRDEISNWIEKVLSYEKNPGNGNYDYLTRVFWTAADKDGSTNMRDFPKYIIENGSYPFYFEHDTTMLEDSAGTYPRGSEVVSQMNNHYGWFNHYGHGAPDQLTVSAPGNNWGGPDRDYLVSLDSCDKFHYDAYGYCRVEPGNGLDSLKNKDFYGIMYLASCYQGAYDEEHFGLFDNYCGPSMAEAFTLLPERGGVAFLGYTRYAKALPSEVLHLFFLEALFDDSLMNIGVTEAISKARVFPHSIHLSHTLFGDPLMPIWTDLPSHLNVNFVDSILPDLTDFEIQVTAYYIDVKDAAKPLKDAYVCLWKDDEVYTTGFTEEDGKVTLPINPETEGKMHLTVTKENFIPYEDTVIVSYNASAVEDFIKSPPFCKTKSILSVGEVLFEFYIPETDKVKIDIYDPTGRRVKRLLDKKMSAGTHQVSWNYEIPNEKYIRNGIYFYQFQYKNQILKGKFLILR